MIVVIGGIKGGSGKTTIATNLTVIQSSRGKKVLLVDGDEQQSSSDWSNQREAREIYSSWTTVQLSGGAIRSQVKKMTEDYDEIIVDTGGRDTTTQRAALTIADVLIVPFQPRSLDIWTIGKLSSLLEDVLVINPNLKTLGLINRADFQGHDNEEALEIIRESQGITCLPLFIGQRKAFANATAEGRGVTELKPIDKKAVAEITKLNKLVFNMN